MIVWECSQETVSRLLSGHVQNHQRGLPLRHDQLSLATPPDSFNLLLLRFSGDGSLTRSLPIGLAADRSFGQCFLFDRNRRRVARRLVGQEQLQGLQIDINALALSDETEWSRPPAHAIDR